MNRDKPGIFGKSGFIVVAGGTVSDERGNKTRTKAVERLVNKLRKLLIQLKQLNVITG